MSDTAQTLNERFAIPGLSFRADASGLVFADIDNAGGTATLCLQGAHLTTWRPKDQAEPVVWLSPLAKYAPGKSIRGGAPVCWPWFGPHATESGFPGHGFARTVDWKVIGAKALDSGETQIRLLLAQNDATRAQWPRATRLELTATVGKTLRIDLTTTNLDTEDIVIGEALHTYFHIGDIGRIQVLGLEGSEFVDKVDGGARKTQAGPVTCAGEVDRVYVNTAAECVIVDPDLKRRVRVAKSGSNSTVVWTPWTEKAEKMGDFGPGRANQGGWREMVCVESANALDNVVSVPAGEAHTLTVVYSAEAL
ncbi:MAG TPA: D-hexose-6-phosphate mutarotase [Thiobacillaceae bacterium]|nr:D-hexose-6-phosphate mutarotase [Thiobacillaceae bacterium]